MKGKNLQPRLLYLARILSKIDGEIKTFSDKQKLREFSAFKPALQKNVKGTYIVKKCEKKKEVQNPPQTIKKNGNRNIYINNYFKCKWIKCSNQKTQTG